MQELKTRSEQEPGFCWRLEDLFLTDEAWEAAFSAAKDGLGALKAAEGTLNSAQSLKSALDISHTTANGVEKLYVYAHMRRDEDNANGKYQGMTDRALSLSVAFSEAGAFLVPEILALEPDTLEAFRKEERGLDVYAHMLGDIVRQRDHILDAGRERLLAAAGEIFSAPKNIYSMLDHADLRFPSVTDENGVQAEITHGRYTLLMESRDERVRRETFEKFYGTYHANENTFAATLASSIKCDVFSARVRGYRSSLDEALFADNISPDVYSSLIEATRAALPALHRYFRVKRMLLKKPELHMHDLYAPLSETPYPCTYEQAKAMVLEALAPLGEDYAARLKEAYANGWIDVYENRGKTSGAYCWGAYGAHPFVLMNYQDNIDNAFTLAHELGHAMHSYYSDKTQALPNAQYRIFVAEVASTVNEVLLMRHLIANERDKGKKLRLMNHSLEQFRTTVFRQVMFAEFEKETHDMAERGEPLTAETLKKAYGALNAAYHKGVALDSGIELEWARISHFYNAFYVYQYATGYSAAVAIARDLVESKDPSRYIEFLSSGGSDYPLELLKIAGIDLTTPAPVKSALGVFEELLSEFEKEAAL